MNFLKIQQLIYLILLCGGVSKVQAQQIHYTLLTTDSTQYEGTIDSITENHIYFKIDNTTSRVFLKTEVLTYNHGYHSGKSIPKKVIVDNTVLQKRWVYATEFGMGLKKYNIQLGIGRRFKVLEPLYLNASLGLSGNNYFTENQVQPDPVTFRLLDVNSALVVPFSKKLKTPFIQLSAGYGFNITNANTFKDGDLISKSGGTQIGIDAGFLLYHKRDKLNFKISLFLERKQMEFDYDRLHFNPQGMLVTRRISELYTMNRFGFRFGLLF